MALGCGRGREGTAGRLSVPATWAAGPEGCKATGLRGGRGARRRRPGETLTKRARAGSRSLRPPEQPASQPPRASALAGQCGAPAAARPRPRPAPPAILRGLTLACPPATTAASRAGPRWPAHEQTPGWVPPRAAGRGAGELAVVLSTQLAPARTPLPPRPPPPHPATLIPGPAVSKSPRPQRCRLGWEWGMIWEFLCVVSRNGSAEWINRGLRSLHPVVPCSEIEIWSLGVMTLRFGLGKGRNPLPAVEGAGKKHKTGDPSSFG